MSVRPLLAVALLAALPATALLAAPTANGRIVYSNNTTTPQHRAYTASSNTFGTAAAMQTGAAQRWMVDRAAPTRNEHIAGYVTTGGVLYVQRWNGSAWSAEWNVTVGGNGVDGRRFDIVYENTTGDAMVVYSTNATGTTGNELAWRKWNGTLWTAAATLNSARFNQAAAVTWIKLKARPTAGSNEIALLASDTGTTTVNTAILSSYIWSGTAWTEAATSHTGSAAATLPNTTGQLMQNECFDLAYESVSGDILVVFTTASTVQQWYRTYSGGTWAAAVSYGTARAAPLQMIAEPDPASDQILVMWNRSASANVYARVWTGTAQGTLTTIGANGVTTAVNKKQIAAHWLNGGGTAYAIALWQTNVATPNGGTKGYNSFNGSTTTWGTAATYNPGVDSVAQWMDSDADPQGTDTLMLTYGDAASDVWAKRLVLGAGPTFTWTNADGGTALTATLASITTQNFVFAYDRYASIVVPTLTSPTATAITNTTATLGANVTSNGGGTLTARGTCWGTTALPTTNCTAEGGTASGVFTQARTALTAGTLLYYRGYATNSAGTGYSPDGTFWTEPTTQASAVSFTAVTPTTMTVNWTRGSGTGVIVLMKQATAVNSDPVDGTYTGYTANAAFASGTQIGTGNYVIFKGAGTSVAVTGLTASTTYHVAVYEYAGAVDTVGVNQGTNYKLTPAIGSQATSAVTIPTLSSPTAIAITNTTATLGANVTSNGGGTLTVRGTCWGPTAAPVTNCLAEGGTAIGVFTQARTGLTASTRLFYRGYATNSAGTGYSPDGSFYTEPTTQASTVSFTAVATTTMTVNWTRGSGNGVLVVMKQGVAVDADPADGTYTGYTASAAYASGSQLGTGNYVIYKGTGTSVPVTGLSPTTTYHVAVYEFAGTIDTAGVDQGTNYKVTPARGSQATIAENRTTVGTPTATVNGCNRITVSAPFTGDANLSGSTAVSRSTTGAAPWTSVCPSITGGSPRSCVDNGVAASSSYYYQVDFADTDGVLGTDPQVIGPFATPACAQNDTTPGSASRVLSGCRQITVTAPFTGDANGNGSVKVEYSIGATWPGTVACATVGGPSPRLCDVTGLSPGTANYYVRVTYVDGDGVGVNAVQQLGPTSTPACTSDQDPPVITFLSPVRNGLISGEDKLKFQVYERVALAGTDPVKWSLDGAALGVAALATNPNYDCGAACTVYEITVTPAAGPHYVTVSATDAAGNVAQSGWAFQGAAAKAGSGRILRRTQSSQICIDCHNLQTHSSQYTSPKYGNWSLDCMTCHTPHATRNIYLVREQIQTPRSGTKSPVFWKADRVNNTNPANSYLGPSTTVYDDGICETCHTRTNHYRNDTSGGDHTHNQGTRCVSCHQHSKGFGGGESGGRNDCESCHANIYDPMATTGGYHHFMNNAWSGGTAASGATTYPLLTPAADVFGAGNPGTTTNRRCLVCHVDHDLFSPDVNTTTGGRGKNLRTDVATTPSTSANFTNTDFDNANTYGGVCLSCHSYTQTKGYAQPDATGRTPAIAKAAFNASAHQYGVAAAYGGTLTNTFSGNCTKCHNDTLAKSYQTSTAKFGNHQSTLRRVLAPLGITTPTDPVEQNFCYRCHHKIGDSTPGGGPVKTAANNDYYGAVTTMTAGSQAVFADMQKGTGATPPASTSTTNTLYFKPTAQENPAEPMPNAHSTADTFNGGTWIGRSMSPWAPTVTYETKSQATNVSGTSLWRMVTFTSPAVASAVTVAAGNWTINIWDRESNTAQNAFVRYMIYKWNAADTIGTTIVAAGNYATEMGTAAAPGGQQTITVAGSAVTLAVGDKISVDLIVRSTATVTTSYTASFYWGSGAQSNLVLPSNVSFSYASPTTSASGRHDVASYQGIHRPNPAEETRGYIAANRHVECEDCHSPHAATSASPVAGASGVGVTTWGTNWTGVTTWNPSSTTAALITNTAEWQVCFKCHSSANANYASWGGTGAAAWTDLGLEFNPNNESYHPVIQALPSTGNRRLAAGALTGGWAPGAVMSCSDCHGADTASARGPHGSTVKWMLNPVTTGTKYYNWPYTTTAGNGTGTGTLLTGTGSTTVPTQNFCFSCHVWSGGGGAHTVRPTGHNVTCVGCHIRVPHGGKALRLLTGANAPARYKPNGAGGGTIYMNGGSRPTTGTMGESNCQTAGGCTQHAATGTLLGW